MSATDELRALLDARGAKYAADDGERVKATCWSYDDGLIAAFAEYDDGTTRFEMGHWRFTPAQAVEATLGHGECEQVLTDCADGLMPPFSAHCGNCGTEWGRTPKFCPGCGARVAGTRDERKAVAR